ncbi:hypothetical protein C8R47DRAFT_1285076 [Mycena vitilis]|nr:hypothetical protein C8R47DRAFT_1285076 [Mycena vitilis]
MDRLVARASSPPAVASSNSCLSNFRMVLGGFVKASCGGSDRGLAALKRRALVISATVSLKFELVLQYIFSEKTVATGCQLSALPSLWMLIDEMIDEDQRVTRKVGNYEGGETLTTKVIVGFPATAGRKILTFFDLFGPRKLNVTVTDTKSVQFRRSRHASPEHSVEITQSNVNPLVPQMLSFCDWLSFQNSSACFLCPASNVEISAMCPSCLLSFNNPVTSGGHNVHYSDAPFSSAPGGATAARCPQANVHHHDRFEYSDCFMPFLNIIRDVSFEHHPTRCICVFHAELLILSRVLLYGLGENAATAVRLPRTDATLPRIDGRGCVLPRQ